MAKLLNVMYEPLLISMASVAESNALCFRANKRQTNVPCATGVCVCANFFPLFCIVFSLITNNFLRIFSLFLEKSILFNLTLWVLMIFFASNALLLNTITHTETERSETTIDLNFSSECCLQWIGKLIRLLSKWHQRTCVHCRFGPIKEEYI